MKLYLQNIVESISFETLPFEWHQINLSHFSDNKKLFDYQQNALKNCLKALYKYYVNCNKDKKQFLELYKNNGLNEELNIKISDEKKYKIFNDYDNDFPIIDNKIPFHCFINRMSFWMATGSGKTLVIVKLIELLAHLIKESQIPENNILFLTHRNDLLEQFKNHIKEFNQGNNQFKINLIDLKQFESSKINKPIPLPNYIDIYYYRSDLIADEQKDKIINFRNYDSNGKWYIILDEAHKGDKEESKRQHYFSILSRNGFLFNFSATFTDEIDYVTCVNNFNLSKFIQNGYGKHIYVSQENITSLEKNNSELEKEKQKILLKILILFTVINKKYLQLKSINEQLYHKPLLLTLVNSVNTEDSDLELFFRELQKVSGGNLDNELFSASKNELIVELTKDGFAFEFENSKIEIKNIDETIKNLQIKDILINVFNTEKHGKIEVIKIPGNQQELIFKVTTSDKPFALMKIGDISQWLKEKLNGYEIVEKLDDESIFKNLNQDKDINILMGSRSFYEGWDSNRPNIILFINIGKGKDSRKFILQSIGRGIRIEPLPGKRKRAIFLYNNKEIDENLFSQIKDKIEFNETLFVYGTKAENLKEVIETLQQEKDDEDVMLSDLFEINPEVQGKDLLIPVYKLSNKIIVEKEDMIKFPIHPDDFNIVKEYFEYIGETITTVKYDCNLKVLSKLKESWNDIQKDKYYLFTKDNYPIQKPEYLLKNILNHFSSYSKEFESFKVLEDEIIHFKKISINEKYFNGIKEKIEKVKNFKNRKDEIQKLQNELKDNLLNSEEFTKKFENISINYVKETDVIYKSSEILKIKYLSNHYYIPVLLDESEKINFIKHIIKTKSELNFIKQLEDYLMNENNFFNQFEWWFFSKIDETLDEVYIPYYQPKTNRIEKFKPDFIFWLKKNNDYYIIFIDPKGTEHTDAFRKIDGFVNTFWKNNERTYNWSNNDTNLCIHLHLFMFKNKNVSVPNAYVDFFIDNLSQIQSILK